MSGTVGTNSSRRSGSIGTAASGATISASDPAIDTNATLGTQWANSTSGEFYVCTDATTDENVWTNVGAGTGDISPYSFGGTQYGYHHGGNEPSLNTIGRYSFTSDGDSADVSTLTVARAQCGGVSSSTHGYSVGGNSGPPSWAHDVIDKMAFASEDAATDVGNCSTDGDRAGTHSSTHGYGYGGKAFTPSQTVVNAIDKFSLSSDGNASDIGNMTVGRYMIASNSSETHGYACGGSNAIPAWAPTIQDTIDKHSFSSDGNSTDVGDLLQTGSGYSGASSTTHGYVANLNATIKQIQKHSFSSDGNATDVGDTTDARTSTGGNSSSTYGYVVAGASSNVIDKYSFSSDGDATDVGDVGSAIGYASGGTFI